MLRGKLCGLEVKVNVKIFFSLYTRKYLLFKFSFDMKMSTRYFEVFVQFLHLSH